MNNSMEETPKGVIIIKHDNVIRIKKIIKIALIVIIVYILGCISIPIYATQAYVHGEDGYIEFDMKTREKTTHYTDESYVTTWKCLHGFKIIDCKSTIVPPDGYDSY